MLNVELEILRAVLTERLPIEPQLSCFLTDRLRRRAHNPFGRCPYWYPKAVISGDSSSQTDLFQSIKKTIGSFGLDYLLNLGLWNSVAFSLSITRTALQGRRQGWLFKSQPLSDGFFLFASAARVRQNETAREMHIANLPIALVGRRGIEPQTY